MLAGRLRRAGPGYSERVDAAQRQLSDQIDDATQRLLGTARIIPDSELRAPSLLPGWTRGRVLAHLARGADAMRYLLIGARSGPDRPGYPSAEALAAALEYGAARPAQELVADLADSAMAFRTIARQLPAQAWQVPVRVPGLDPFPAAQLLTRRLVEVELHHCDLAAGYGAADWPATFTALELGEPMRSQRQDRLARPPQPAGVAPWRGRPAGVSASRPPGPWRPRPWVA